MNKKINIIPIEDRIIEIDCDLDADPIYYVYAHYTEKGELFYIGKGKNDRAWHKRGRNNYWTKITKKYKYEVKIIEDNLDEQQALILEVQLIERCRPRCNFAVGFNASTSCRKHTDHEKEARKLSCIAVWENWPEEKLRRSVKYSGAGNPFYGQKHTDETKAKMKVYKQQLIKCVNLNTKEELIVSGTREAAEKTKTSRGKIMKILKSGLSKRMEKKWDFVRLP
jgi:hypothetical protein